VQRGRLTRQDEDAGTDDATDAEQYEIDSAERLLQLSPLMLRMHLLDGLVHEDAA